MKSLLHSARRLLWQPDFLAVFVLLGTAAFGLNFLTSYLKLHYQKRALALRAQLDAPDGIPAQLGSWIQVSKDTAIDDNTEHVLGTNKYLFRWYVDSSVMQPDTVSALKDMSTEQRGEALARIQQTHPEAVMNLSITYYTGLVDTVAHIPDRCMLGNGFEKTGDETIRGQALGKSSDGEDRLVSFNLLGFDDPTGRGRPARNVAYFFHVNGHYESSPLGVRWALQDLREPCGYYAKVELMSITPALHDPQGQAGCLRAMEDFLAKLLPEFERCLPDWRAAHQKNQ